MATSGTSGFSSIGGLSLGDLLRAGAEPASGKAADINKAGQDTLNDILSDPASRVSTRYTRAFGQVIEIRAPDRRGVRYYSDGTFIGLLEP